MRSSGASAAALAAVMLAAGMPPAGSAHAAGPAGGADAAAGREAAAKEIEALRLKVYSSDALDRLYAAATLLEKGTPEALKVIEGVLAGSNEQAARLSVLEAVDRRRDERFIDSLIRLLGDPDERVRRRAAEVLGRFRDHGVLKRLERLVHEENVSETTLGGVVEALVLTRQTGAVGLLIELLRSPYKSVRAGALEALRGITPEDFGEDYRAWLWWWRFNRHKTQLQWDRDLLPKLQRRVEELKAELARARRDAVRWALAYEDTLADPKARAKFLRELLKSDYAELRAHAAQALPRVAGAAGVREALEVLLGDRDAQVAAAAAAGLGTLGDRKAVPALEGLLGREDPRVRAAAAEALGRLRARDAADDLLRLLNDREEAVRSASVKALGDLQAPEAFEGLLARLSDPSPGVREAAVAAVARYKDPRTVPALVRVLLEDKTAPRARFSAARFLADFAGKEAEDALIRGLADGDPGVRRAAAAGLGKRADLRPVDPLLARALADGDPTVREEAWNSALALLRSHGDPRTLDAVSRRLLQNDAPARAAEVLGLIDGLAPPADREGKALFRLLRRRRADAALRAGLFERAAADYRLLLAAGERDLLPRLVEALERGGRFLEAAQVHLDALEKAPEAEKQKRMEAVLALAEKALAAEPADPQQALLILRALRAAAEGALPGSLEGRLGQAAGAAGKALEERSRSAAPRVRELVARAAAGGADALRSARDELAKLGWAAVPALLEALADGDVKVRAAAADLLRALTKHREGFDPRGDQSRRDAAVSAWRRWFEALRAVPPPAAPAAPAGPASPGPPGGAPGNP